VGDTRFYVFRQGRLIQVTTDQTMAQLLVEEGKITPDEARTHPYGQLLDQCVGCPMCEPSTGTYRIEKGDLLLHSTDGLHDALPETEIVRLLATPGATVDAIADALIQAVLDAGGNDNVTLVLAAV
jgi:protein phosphatase